MDNIKLIDVAINFILPCFFSILILFIRFVSLFFYLLLFLSRAFILPPRRGSIDAKGSKTANGIDIRSYFVLCSSWKL